MGYIHLLIVLSMDELVSAKYFTRIKVYLVYGCNEYYLVIIYNSLLHFLYRSIKDSCTIFREMISKYIRNIYVCKGSSKMHLALISQENKEQFSSVKNMIMIINKN